MMDASCRGASEQRDRVYDETMCQTCGTTQGSLVYPYGGSRAQVCEPCMNSVAQRVDMENRRYRRKEWWRRLINRFAHRKVQRLNNIISADFLAWVIAIGLILAATISAFGQVDQKAFTFQTDASSGDGEEGDITGLSLMGVTLTGSTGANRVVAWEVADSVGAYTGVLCTNILTQAQANVATASSTVPQRFQCSIGGFKKFRARISGGSSGTITVVGLGLSRVSQRSQGSGGGGGGTNVALDLGDNGVNESVGLNEIATINDFNAIFTSPALNKLLIDVSKKWPSATIADTTSGFATNPPNCLSPNFARGIDASGQCEGAQVQFSEIAGTASDSQIPDLNTLSTGLPGNKCVETDISGKLITTASVCNPGAVGSSIILDLGNNGSNESIAITKIATIGDTNNIFSEPNPDVLLFDVSKKWPTAQNADVATVALGFPTNPNNCTSPNFARGIDANGVCEGAQVQFSELGGIASDPQIPDLNSLSTGLPATRCVQTDSSGKLSSTVGPCLTQGLQDIDYGPITVSGGGTIMTIDPGAVTYANIVNPSATGRFFARSSPGTGPWEEVAPSQAKTILAYNFSELIGSASDPQIPDLNTLGTGLTPSRCVETDATGKLGVAAAACGGGGPGGSGITGATSHGIMVATGGTTGTSLGVATNGQIPIGSTGIDPILATITPTTNQTTVTNGPGSIAIGIANNPTLPGTTTGNFNGPLAGNSTTASAFDHVPSPCPTDRYAISQAASGNFTCAQVNLAAGVTNLLPVGSGGHGATPTVASQLFVSTSPTAGNWLTTTGTGTPVLATNPVLVTPNLGTPSAINLANATNLPITGITTSSSAQMATLVNDETGTGLLVFNTNPILVTPNLGTPSAINLANATNLPGAAIVDNSVTFAKLPDIPNANFLARNSAGTGDPEPVAPPVAKALLNINPPDVTNRVTEVATTTSATINIDTTDTYRITGLTSAVAFNNPTFTITPKDQQILTIIICSATSQNISWPGTEFNETSGTFLPSLPSTTTGGNTCDMHGFRRKSASSKWSYMATTYNSIANRLKPCIFTIGDEAPGAPPLTDPQIIQTFGCPIYGAATIDQVNIRSKCANTPSVMVHRYTGTTPTPLLSSAMATNAAGALNCSRTSAGTGREGRTCLGTVINSVITATEATTTDGVMIGVTSGSAAGCTNLHVVVNVIQ